MASLSPAEIIAQQDHRPWPMPGTPWRYYQEWNDVVFLHWPVPKEKLEAHIPQELAIDTLHGQAWVSLVAFTMERIRFRFSPAFRPISRFHEVNIRTYIRYGERSGVYFLSIEAGKRLSSDIARFLSGMPYRFSSMKRTDGRFRSSNAAANESLDVSYTIGRSLKEKDETDLWLTERYALSQDSGKWIHHYDVHHIEWPVHQLSLDQLELNYPKWNDLLQGSPERVHYSPGVGVCAWPKNRMPA